MVAIAADSGVAGPPKHADMAIPVRVRGADIGTSLVSEPAPLPYRGVDASFVPQLEWAGVAFRDEAGVVRDPIALFAARGINLLRLRVWHTPLGGWCGTPATLAMARRARDNGLAVMLCIHYSDSWADPGQQTTPAAWQGQSPAALVQSVESYTRSLVAALDAQGTPPAMVQIGNETTDGMLWPTGRISTSGFDAFAALFSAGARGAVSAVPASRRPLIVCHIDRGGDNAASRWFFDQMRSRGVEYDVIGLSYYPWWHGTLSALSQNVRDLAARYGKPVMLVETAYPFTLGWNDSTWNFVGLPSQLIPGLDASPTGQSLFANAVGGVMRGIPAGRGLGVCWWGPDYVANPAFGSPWENLAGFDFGNRALPVLRAVGGQ
jgi:arabinogalactan endo-1,4-beta-galactosidase